jgi:hypothetical protein
MNILIVDFMLEGISEEQYEAMCDDVAPAFAGVPGLASKVWLADREAGVYGGVYTFESAEAADEFLASELFAQVGSTPGFAGITVKRFGVLAGPTSTTRGLVATHA